MVPEKRRDEGINTAKRGRDGEKDERNAVGDSNGWVNQVKLCLMQLILHKNTNFFKIPLLTKM